MKGTLFFVLFLISSTAFACDDLYEVRHKDQASAEAAFECYKSESEGSDRAIAAHALSRMGYLKFTIAEFFLDYKLDALQEAFTLSEKALFLYGAKYDSDLYATLPKSEQDIVGFTYYAYGLSLSRYVDLKGKLEAIRRMEDIKKSMNTIMRMNQNSVAFGGALRTLAIFNMKVPSIAGGQIKLSLPYIEKAISTSLFRGSLSRYPGNNLARAEITFKVGKAEDACGELAALNALSAADIESMANGYVLETQSDLSKARDLFNSQCR